MQVNTYSVYSHSNIKQENDSLKINKLVEELESFKTADEVKSYLENAIGFFCFNSFYFTENCKLDIKDSQDFYKVKLSFADEVLVFSYRKF